MILIKSNNVRPFRAMITLRLLVLAAILFATSGSATANSDPAAETASSFPVPSSDEVSPRDDHHHPLEHSSPDDWSDDTDYDASYDDHEQLASALLERIRHLAFRHSGDHPTEPSDSEDDSGDVPRRQLRSGLAKTAAGNKNNNAERPLFLEDDSPEPSCQELRTIWRLTKRAARNSLLTNEIPKHPANMFGYMVQSPELISSVASVNDYGLPEGQAFGRIVLEPPSKNGKHRGGVGLYGANDGLRSRTAGSYDRVEEKLRQGIFSEKPFDKLGGKYYYPDKYPKTAAKNYNGHHTGGSSSSSFYDKPVGKSKMGVSGQPVYGDMVHHTKSRHQQQSAPTSPVSGALNRVKADSLMHHLGNKNSQEPGGKHRGGQTHRDNHGGRKSGREAATDDSSVVYGVYDNHGGGLFTDADFRRAHAANNAAASPFAKLREHVVSAAADSTSAADSLYAIGGQYSRPLAKKPRRVRYGSVYDKPDSYMMADQAALPVGGGGDEEEEDDDSVTSSSGSLGAGGVNGRLRLYDSLEADQSSGEFPSQQEPSPTSGGLVSRHRHLLPSRQGFADDDDI